MSDFIIQAAGGDVLAGSQRSAASMMASAISAGVSLYVLSEEDEVKNVIFFQPKSDRNRVLSLLHPLAQRPADIEVLNRIVDHEFERLPQPVQILHEAKGRPAILPERFVLSGTLRAEHWMNGYPVVTFLYECVHPDYLPSTESNEPIGETLELTPPAAPPLTEQEDSDEEEEDPEE